MNESPSLPPLTVGGRCILLAAWFLGALPIAVQRAISGPLTVLMCRLGHKSLKWLYRNVHEIYRLPAQSPFAAMFAEQVMSHQVAAAFDSCRLLNAPGQLKLHDAEAAQHTITKARMASEHGVIVVTAHLGNWEIAGRFMAEAFDQKVYVLAKPSRSPALTNALTRWRHTFKMQVLWTDKKTLLRDMMGALRAGTALGFVMDQKPAGRKGPEVTFLGQPKTPFVSGPGLLAAKFDTAVIGLYCLRTGPLSYRVICREIFPAKHGVKDEIVLTQRMAQDIEDVIRLYPEQWVWNYKRFIFPSE